MGRGGEGDQDHVPSRGTFPEHPACLLDRSGKEGAAGPRRSRAVLPREPPGARPGVLGCTWGWRSGAEQYLSRGGLRVGNICRRLQVGVSGQGVRGMAFLGHAGASRVPWLPAEGG